MRAAKMAARKERLKLINACRTLLRPQLELPRGIQKETESLVMTACRKMVAACTLAEQAGILAGTSPTWWTAELLNECYSSPAIFERPAEAVPAIPLRLRVLCASTLGELRLCCAT